MISRKPVPPKPPFPRKPSQGFGLPKSTGASTKTLWGTSVPTPPVGKKPKANARLRAIRGRIT